MMEKKIFHFKGWKEDYRLMEDRDRIGEYKDRNNGFNWLCRTEVLG
jgi:hypothetical protein